MFIQYFKNKIFKIANKNSSLVLAPEQDEKTAKLKADIFVFSIRSETPAPDKSFIIDMPGECDIKGIFIHGFNFFGKNLAYLINTENITLCALGRLEKELDDQQIEKLDVVDVLILDISKLSLALKILKQIEPKMVIPVSSKKQNLKNFLDEVRVEPREIIGKLNLKKKDLFDEKMEVVLFK